MSFSDSRQRAVLPNEGLVCVLFVLQELPEESILSFGMPPPTLRPLPVDSHSISLQPSLLDGELESRR